MSKSTKHLISELQKIKDSLGNQSLTDLSTVNEKVTAHSPAALQDLSKSNINLDIANDSQSLQQHLTSLTPQIIEDIIKEQQLELQRRVKQRLTLAAEEFIKEKIDC